MFRKKMEQSSNGDQFLDQKDGLYMEKSPATYGVFPARRCPANATWAQNWSQPLINMGLSLFHTINHHCILNILKSHDSCVAYDIQQIVQCIISQCIILCCNSVLHQTISYHIISYTISYNARVYHRRVHVILHSIKYVLLFSP